MEYTRRRAETTVDGLIHSINDTILLLLCHMPDREPAADQFAMLADRLATIAAIRLSPGDKLLSSRFIYDRFFLRIFENAGYQALARRLASPPFDLMTLRPDLDLPQVAQRLKRFHRAFADTCAAGAADEATIRELIRSL